MSPQKGGFHKCTGAAPRQSPDSAAAAIDLILSAAKFLMSASPVFFCRHFLLVLVFGDVFGAPDTPPIALQFSIELLHCKTKNRRQPDGPKTHGYP